MLLWLHLSLASLLVCIWNAAACMSRADCGLLPWLYSACLPVNWLKTQLAQAQTESRVGKSWGHVLLEVGNVWLHTVSDRAAMLGFEPVLAPRNPRTSMPLMVPSRG